MLHLLINLLTKISKEQKTLLTMETPYLENFFVLVFVVFFNWDSIHAKLSSHKRKRSTKNETLTEASF